MRREAARAHRPGVRGDSALCLLQYARLKLSKPGLAPRPWHRLPPSLCQCQLQLGLPPARQRQAQLSSWQRLRSALTGFLLLSFLSFHLDVFHHWLVLLFFFQLFLCFLLAWFLSFVLIFFVSIQTQVHAHVFLLLQLAHVKVHFHQPFLL